MANLYYYKTEGKEPDIDAVEPCNVRGDGIHIGSATCKECPFCEDYNNYHNWILCSRINEATNERGITLVQEQTPSL